MTVSLPSQSYGYVTARLLRGVADAGDADRLPDGRPAVGTVTFVPIDPLRITQPPDAAFITREAIRCTIDSNGFLTDPAGARGVWLFTGQWNVRYSIESASIPQQTIMVMSSHTESAPLELPVAVPVDGPEVTPTQYDLFNQRLSSLETLTNKSLVNTVNGRNGEVTIAVADLTDAKAHAKNLLLSTDAGAARSAIGAAASTHTHSLNNISTTGTKDATTVLFGDAAWRPPLSETGVLSSTVKLNDYKTPGVWRRWSSSGISATANNFPYDGAYGLLEVYAGSAQLTQVMQRFTSFDPTIPGIWTRRLEDTTWSVWRPHGPDHTDTMRAHLYTFSKGGPTIYSDGIGMGFRDGDVHFNSAMHARNTAVFYGDVKYVNSNANIIFSGNITVEGGINASGSENGVWATNVTNSQGVTTASYRGAATWSANTANVHVDCKASVAIEGANVLTFTNMPPPKTDVDWAGLPTADASAPACVFRIAAGTRIVKGYGMRAGVVYMGSRNFHYKY